MISASVIRTEGKKRASEHQVNVVLGSLGKFAVSVSQACEYLADRDNSIGRPVKSKTA